MWSGILLRYLKHTFKTLTSKLLLAYIALIKIALLDEHIASLSLLLSTTHQITKREAIMLILLEFLPWNYWSPTAIVYRSIVVRIDFSREIWNNFYSRLSFYTKFLQTFYLSSDFYRACFLVAIARAIIGLLFVLLQFKKFELYWGAVFLRSVHTFSCFLKSNWSSDFGHAETGSGAKKQVILRCVFNSNFKVQWENGVWTKICFLACGFLFTWISLRFLLISNPFIVHSRASFLLEPKFHFSLVVFCSHAVFLHFVF